MEWQCLECRISLGEVGLKQRQSHHDCVHSHECASFAPPCQTRSWGAAHEEGFPSSTQGAFQGPGSRGDDRNAQRPARRVHRECEGMGRRARKKALAFFLVKRTLFFSRVRNEKAMGWRVPAPGVSLNTTKPNPTG